jgi:hypothetical protein
VVLKKTAAHIYEFTSSDIGHQVNVFTFNNYLNNNKPNHTALSHTFKSYEHSIHMCPHIDTTPGWGALPVIVPFGGGAGGVKLMELNLCKQMAE